MDFNHYTHQLFLIIKKSRKTDLVNWIRNHPNAAAKLGLDDVIDGEVVKITTTPPPNAGANHQVLGTASWITGAQRAFWIQVKNNVPPAWAGDIEGAIRRTDNRLNFNDWLASQTPPLYRLEEEGT